MRSTGDTSLDRRGLRLYDPDGHAIYWHAAEEGTDYSTTGLSGGICTAGQVWDQDPTRGRFARPGRLRRRRGPPPALSGTGKVECTLTLVPGEAWRRSIMAFCRAGHPFPSMPDWGVAADVARYVAGLLVPALRRHDWSFEPRLECPQHRQEREAVERALQQLAQQDRGVTKT